MKKTNTYQVGTKELGWVNVRATSVRVRRNGDLVFHKGHKTVAAFKQYIGFTRTSP